MRQNMQDFTHNMVNTDIEESDAKRENANVDANSPMGMMLQLGGYMAETYADDVLIDREHIALHQNGDIHIHDKDFYAHGTLTCCQIDLDKLFTGGFSTGNGGIREPQSIRAYAALACIAIQSNQNSQHGGQSIPMLDVYLAPGVVKTFVKELKDRFEASLRTILICKDELGDSDNTKLFEVIDNIVGSIDVDADVFYLLTEHVEKIANISMAAAMDQVEAVLAGAVIATEKHTDQALEAMVHNLNTMSSRAGAQVPFSSVNFGTDTTTEGRMVSASLLRALNNGMGNGETSIFPNAIFKVKDDINLKKEDPNYDLFQTSLYVTSRRHYPNYAFIDAPYNLQYYVEGDHSTEVTYMGCRTRSLSNAYDPSYEKSIGRGNASFTTINLPRLGLKYGIKLNSGVDYDGFFKELDKLVDTVGDQLLIRLKHQGSRRVANFPFLMGQGIWKDSDKLYTDDILEDVVKQATISVGYIGLAECLTALIGSHHGESEEAQELGLTIITRIRKRLDNRAQRERLNYTLLATPAEGLSGRFTKIDKEEFGIVEGVTDRKYYTNSCHVPVYYHTSAFKKIEIEAPYHALSNAGHIMYVELGGDMSVNTEAMEEIINKMIKEGVGYASLNVKPDRCPRCNYLGPLGDTCPSCGAADKEVFFERIRTITGYLQKLSRWNDAKRAECEDRVEHDISQPQSLLEELN